MKKIAPLLIILGAIAVAAGCNKNGSSNNGTGNATGATTNSSMNSPAGNTQAGTTNNTPTTSQ